MTGNGNEILTRWGFTERYAALAAGRPELTPGRVVSQEKGMYKVVCEAGELSAVVSGRFRHEAEAGEDYPAVGDFVLLSADAEGGASVIRELLPRAGAFTRKAAGRVTAGQVVAANVDTVFVCMSLNNDFNPRRLERYVSVAWESGATPVVVLTKADLCDDVEERLREAREVSSGAEVLAVSSMEREGVAAVAPYIRPGKTVALLGSSGVGKSTLINRLLGEELLDTGGLRDDDRGRHTTTRRQLLPLPGGGLVMDTPGMRELGMWDAAAGLERAFSDVAELVRECRFNDCTHANEPGCAVRAAIKDGRLTPERWESWLKLNAENARTESRETMLAMKKAKFKQIALTNKKNRK